MAQEEEDEDDVFVLTVKVVFERRNSTGGKEVNQQPPMTHPSFAILYTRNCLLYILYIYLGFFLSLREKEKEKEENVRYGVQFILPQKELKNRRLLAFFHDLDGF